MMGYSCVQLEPADSSRVARNRKLAVTWPRKTAMGSPPTWKSVTLSAEKSMVTPPHGEVDSVSSSKGPTDTGALRVKWAAARAGRRRSCFREGILTVGWFELLYMEEIREGGTNSTDVYG